MIWDAIKSIIITLLIAGCVGFVYLLATAEEPVYDVTIYATYQIDDSTEVIKFSVTGRRPYYYLDAGCVKGNAGGGIRCGVKRFSQKIKYREDLEVKK